MNVAIMSFDVAKDSGSREKSPAQLQGSAPPPAAASTVRPAPGLYSERAFVKTRVTPITH